jgi:D-3-phosphoglycerate dehydrogenase
MKEHSFPRSKIKIFLAENIHPVAYEALRKEGFQVDGCKNALSEKELLDVAKDVHILGIRSKTKVSSAFLSEAKRLMSVGCFCIGTDQVDLETACLKGVTVFNAPFSNTRSVAEMVLAEIVMLARRLGDRNIMMHAGQWDKSATHCHEVRGKTLGIVGYGHIGSQVSVLAESFGMKVIYYDIVTKLPLGNSRQLSNLEDLLKDSDFVTLHVPDTSQTRNMISKSELKAMKKDSKLINASRGTVVDLKALKASLHEKHLGGAAIDVFPSEPENNSDKFDSELRGLSNVILTPHLGGSTEEAQENIGIEVSASLSRFVNNGSTTNSVNFPQVDLPVQHQTHRVLNVHRNVPGVLKQINSIVSDLGANIQAQYLATDSRIGYLIMDLDKKLSDQVKEKIRELPTSIRTRILY